MNAQRMMSLFAKIVYALPRPGTLSPVAWNPPGATMSDERRHEHLRMNYEHAVSSTTYNIYYYYSSNQYKPNCRKRRRGIRKIT
jgi:DNA-binding transcriptional MocR family regulator